MLLPNFIFIFVYHCGSHSSRGRLFKAEIKAIGTYACETAAETFVYGSFTFIETFLSRKLVLSSLYIHGD